MVNLAINGGTPVRKKAFKAYRSLGLEERNAVDRVMKRGILSKYYGSWCDDFFGGAEVRGFEKEWCETFNSKYAVSVNSNSSGLLIALGACDIGYGDEVIVSPYTMSVSATVPLVWNAVPVFADIDPNHYCISPAEFKKKITKNTKAVIIVHVFGCPADMDEILNIARENNIRVIEDCAQAPGATYKGKMVGTLGDIGVFSLNYHKHIHTGEGGVCTTNDDNLARRMQLIRNHAESVVEGAEERNLINMIGFNLRLTEIQAAIGREQLIKLKKEVEVRQKIAAMYNDAFSCFKFIKTTELFDRTHVYYVQPFQYIAGEVNVHRNKVIEAVCAELSHVETRENEGVPIFNGYIKPLYLLPLFQNKIAYKNNFPFGDSHNYLKGICPVVEDMYFNRLWYHDLTRSPLSQEDVRDVINAYIKVFENIRELA